MYYGLKLSVLLLIHLLFIYGPERLRGLTPREDLLENENLKPS